MPTLREKMAALNAKIRKAKNKYKPKPKKKPPLPQQAEITLLSEEVIQKQAAAQAKSDVYAGCPVPASEQEFWPDQVYRKAYAEGVEYYRMLKRCEAAKHEANTEGGEKNAHLLKANLQEAKIEERALLVAQKRSKGIPEVKPCNLVTVLQIDTDQEDTYYLVRAKLTTRFHETVVEDIDPVPNLPDSISLIRTCSPLGEKLLSRFIGDEFSVHVPVGRIHYRVIWTEPFVGSSEVKPKETDAALKSEKHDVYTGRGRNDGTQSEAMDGSRYIGFMARDNGAFGSFPMHDDYGDESDAEGKDHGEWGYIDTE